VNLWTSHWKSRALKAEEKQAQLEAAVERVRKWCEREKAHGQTVGWVAAADAVHHLIEQKQTP
jgi:hypothetical protein